MGGSPATSAHASPPTRASGRATVARACGLSDGEPRATEEEGVTRGWPLGGEWRGYTSTTTGHGWPRDGGATCGVWGAAMPFWVFHRHPQRRRNVGNGPSRQRRYAERCAERRGG